MKEELIKDEALTDNSEHDRKILLARIQHYQRVLNVLQESGAVTPTQVRKAHDLVNEVGR